MVLRLRRVCIVKCVPQCEFVGVCLYSEGICLCRFNGANRMTSVCVFLCGWWYLFTAHSLLELRSAAHTHNVCSSMQYRYYRRRQIDKKESISAEILIRGLPQWCSLLLCIPHSAYVFSQGRRPHAGRLRAVLTCSYRKDFHCRFEFMCINIVVCRDYLHTVIGLSHVNVPFVLSAKGFT